MNIQEIERLVDLVAASRVLEVSVRVDGSRVTIRRKKRHGLSASSGVGMPRAAPAAPASEEEHTSSDTAHLVTAPLVGVFHPASPPITQGTRVRTGQVVGAIESMKLMNDVRTDRDGLVEAVLVEPGMPVEYGQPLFRLAGESLDVELEAEAQSE